MRNLFDFVATVQAEEQLTDDQIIMMVIEMVSAGEDTSATTAEWMLLNLANEEGGPEVQEEIRTEALTVLGPKGLPEPNNPAKAQHKSLAFINETLRYTPTAPATLFRAAKTDTQVNSGKTVHLNDISLVMTLMAGSGP
jgi:cytochrome P450